MLGSKIRQTILNEVSKWIYYSVILDCTLDVSHTEQMTLIIRFVCRASGREPCVRDKFLGFGHGNDANMRGKLVGVQSRMFNMNPLAFFVPYSTHSLNLAVTDAALSCKEAVTFLGIVHEVYNYFSASTHRRFVLKEHVSDLTVKPLSETR
ncbi:hypothetical protein PR048_000400 [Dryococelus australis]|uniref:DUF4371 domain-containing protein n=1 Tax=Dryococelus australis TaxID=614101 RepID=A0ABQ9IFT7_9NEOP|nr:hypothetical protein PR048_000400 [Dryococelus australis]